MDRDNTPGGPWEDKELDREDDLSGSRTMESERADRREYDMPRGDRSREPRFGGDRPGDTRYRENRSRGYEQRGYNRQSNDWKVPGPYTGVGPKSYRRSDERILDEVNERLTRHGQIDAAQVRVSVDQGEVTLHGSVNSRREKYIAEYIAESVLGVREVYNNLRVTRADTVRQSWKAPGEAPSVRYDLQGKEDEQSGIPNTGTPGSSYASSGAMGMSTTGGQGISGSLVGGQPSHHQPQEMGNRSYDSGRQDDDAQTRHIPPSELLGEGMTPPSADFEATSSTAATLPTRPVGFEKVQHENLHASGEMMNNNAEMPRDEGFFEGYDEEDEPHPTDGPAAIGSGPTDIAAGVSGSTYGDRDKDRSKEELFSPQIPQTGTDTDTFISEAVTQRNPHVAAPGQTDIVSQIRPGMIVIGRSGEKVGVIKEIRQQDFLLDRPMARDIYVPFSAWDRVEDDQLRLTVDAEAISQQGWEQPPIL